MTCGALFDQYRKLGRDPDARLVAQQYVAVLVQEAKQENEPVGASMLWSQARGMFTFLQAPDQALACQRRAVELTPNDFGKRHMLASLLAQNKQYPEAAEHFRWCLRRRPDDRALSEQFAAAQRKALKQQAAVSDSETLQR